MMQVMEFAEDGITVKIAAPDVQKALQDELARIGIVLDDLVEFHQSKVIKLFTNAYTVSLMQCSLHGDYAPATTDQAKELDTVDYQYVGRYFYKGNSMPCRNVVVIDIFCERWHD